MNSNKITIDLNKVSYAHLFYKNQNDNRKLSAPEYPTIFGDKFDGTLLAGHLESHPGETMEQRRVRRGITFDKWIPTLHIVVGNRDLYFEGKKALSIWKAFNAKQYGKKDKQDELKPQP